MTENVGGEPVSDVVVEARKALEGVTEGDWSVIYESCDCSDGMCGHGAYPYALHGPADHATLDSDYSDKYKQDYGHQITEIVGLSEADAEFVAWCRTGVPALLDRIEEQDRQIATMQRLLRNPQAVAALDAAERELSGLDEFHPSTSMNPELPPENRA